MKKLIIRLILGGLTAGILGVIALALLFVYFSFGLPKIQSLADYKPALPSQILSKDGVVLAEIGKERREIAKFDEIPKLIVNSFLSAEDDGFYEHKGVDYLGVLRAMLANIKAGRVVQGGSTITQQVAKSLLLSRERSISRKVKDFLLAQKIEEKFTKEEILFLYLNQVYLGGGYYGVKTAFRGYFGKELSEATVAESAMIAGLLVAPGRYSPYINPKFAYKRQHYVLGRLLANGKISKEQYEEALKEKIRFRLREDNDFKAGYFTDWIRQRVITAIGEEEFLTGGYKVQTTLDYELQKAAELQVRYGVKEVDKRQGFNGPLATLAPSEINDDYIKKFRTDFYMNKSEFFTLSEALEREYEMAFDEEELTKIIEHRDEFTAKIRSKNYLHGNLKDDKLLSALEVGKSYEAYVLHTDDDSRLIYVNLGGLTGIIPYRYFRWAHERVISEERNFFPYVTRPSSIVKPGDKILVELMGKSTGLLPQMWSTGKERLERSKDKEIVEKEKYLLVMLDQEPVAEAGLVSIRPDTGELISMVGGYDFKRSQFNRALQSRRQPGSSFKPLLFAAGLENGFTPNSIIIDSPEALGGVDASLNWKPRNYDGKFKGPITYRNSLEQSRNIPTIKITEKIGVPTIFKFMERIGFNAKLDRDLSLSLGSFGVTLMDIVKTFSIFPNGGKLLKVKSIVSLTDREGRQYDNLDNLNKDDVIAPEVDTAEVTPVEEPVQQEVVQVEEEKKINPFHELLNDDQVYDPRLAYIMTNLMKGVVNYGTGKGAKSVSTFLGGKTGTTNNYVDAWFIGFSANVVTGVWTGFDDNKTLGWGETGAKTALPIWKDFMQKAIERYGERDFSVPLGIVNVPINKETGRLAKNGEKEYFLESFVEGTEPGSETVEEIKVDPKGQLLEDDEYFNNQ